MVPPFAGGRIQRRIAMSVFCTAAGSLAIAFASVSTAAAQAASPAAVPDDSAASTTIDREVPWPRTIRSGGATLTVSAPQVDAWNGFALAARFAVMAKGSDAGTQYGVVTIDARTFTDHGTRLVLVDHARATASRFPGVSGQSARRWGDAVARNLTGPSRLIALDRLETSLAASALVVSGDQPLDTAPPHIEVSRVPAVLVAIDGPPEYHAVGSGGLQRVVNTRALIVRAENGQHYLRILGGWMHAPALRGPWSVVERPDADVAAALDSAFARATAAQVVDELTGAVTPPAGLTPVIGRRAPAIHVATRPTELVVIDGPPNWTPVPEVRVFYLLNTTARVLKSGEDFQIYALIAGRWFRAKMLSGPWTYVRADALPRDFARIPDSSPIENVKASVAGTAQARLAAVATTIAQTAAISASGARFARPHVDGAPSFRPIDSTSLEYVINTARPIIRVGGEHGEVYAVENGVWFRAASVDGPWSVATSVPAEIAEIPSTSPVYPVRFVHAYGGSGDTVFVGYTSGYVGTYVDPATKVVVAGTGHQYRSWIDHEWFGAPVTYGLGANLTFTPWTGWRVAYGFGWTWRDAVTAGGWGLGAYPSWEPLGWGWAYGPSTYPWHPAWAASASLGQDTAALAPGGWTAYSGDIYRRWRNQGLLRRVASGADAWTAYPMAARVGVSYNSHTGIATTGQHGAIENVREGLAMRPREVAVTPTGALVAARNYGLGLERGDRVVHIRAGEGDVARRTIPAEYHDARITASASITQTSAGEVARPADELYAGPDGAVYRRRNGRWERYGANGWRADAGAAATLDRARRMRTAGEERVSLLRDAASILSSPFTRGPDGPRP